MEEQICKANLQADSANSIFVKREECTCQHFSSFKADPPTAYRKFLRISDIRELWAATRIL